ncbi:ABC transporter permease [Zhaonella formicivorans]|uniref:ABC transporter permease n=1 Tax=Zhaonella formicivorans TaxID=2528593 RepID=UPI0010D703A1|nr:FtsX-like permease family protein [Zhaonella formicivorans]
MRLDSIAVKNLTRRSTRTLFLLLIIIIAMGTVASLYSLAGSMKKEIGDTFDEIGPNLIVKPDEDGQAFSYGGVVIPAAGKSSFQLTNAHILAINTIPNRENIAVVAPKLLGTAQAGKDKITVVGVDFPYELKLKKWWTYQGTKPNNAEDLLVGYRLAKRMSWSLGQEVELDGTKFKIAAILDEQGSDDDGVVFMQLLAAQKLLKRENLLSFIEVAAYCTTCPIEQIAAQISRQIPGAQVLTLAEAVQAREESVGKFFKFALVLSIVIILAGALVIALTMMSTVNQRTAEIGIFRAVGFRQSHVFEIILTEALAVGFLGGLFGFSAGIPLARLAAPYVSDLRLYITWDPVLGFAVVVGAAVLTVLASLYPAIKAAQLDPAEALRFV